MYDYKHLKHKAAGHDGTLTDEDELLIFKPLMQQELEFYEAIQRRSLKQSDPDGGDIPLWSWLPAFLGVLNDGSHRDMNPDATVVLQESSVVSNLNNQKFLVLENLLHGFSKPNILDVKLGRVLYDEKASKEKRQRMNNVSNNTTSGTLGFRICGMSLLANKATKAMHSSHYEETGSGYIFVNKIFGRTRTKDNIQDAFDLYFANDALSTKRIKQLKEIFLQRIQLFYNTILDAEVRMISTSLLFIYEGDPNRWDELGDQDQILRNDFIDSAEEDESDEESDSVPGNKILSSLSLIDFAHSKFAPGIGYDENIVDGVENLMTVFQNLNL